MCVEVENHEMRINTYHAAGVSRRVVKHYPTLFKNVNILEFHDHIWNYLEKCIQKSTNMRSIGSLIREIDVNISEIWENKTTFPE